MKVSTWEMGLSSCSVESIERNVFEGYAKNGIPLMEISLNWDKYSSINWKKTERNAYETGVRLWSFHLPFAPFSQNNIASTDANIRNRSIELQKEYIKRVGDIGIGVVIIHPSGEPIMSEDRKEMLKYSAESLGILANEGLKCGVTIAVENLPRTCLGKDSHEIKELISVHSNLHVCFDTNHLLSQPINAFIEDVGEKIITTHISDFDFKNERHWLPGEGYIDWIEVLNALEKKSYRGPLMYEMSFAPPSTGTIDRRMLTFQDLKNNYLSLLRKERPEKIGVVNEEKCVLWKDVK